MASSTAQDTAAFLHAHGIRVDEGTLHRMLEEAIRRLPRILYPADPARELSPKEIEILKEGGFELEPSDLGDEDPLTRTAAEYAALLETSLTTRQAAERLGVDPSRIRQKLTADPPALYGIRLGDGWRLPELQFDGDRLLPGWSAVAAALPRDLHPLAIFRWLTLANPDLEARGLEGLDRPLSPREWLRLGFPPEEIVRLARDL